MPKLSVVVPNYNHAKYLPQRLDSILSQTYRDYELIILDDHSTDDSLTVIDSYARRARADGLPVRVFVNGSNSGSPFAQWGRGVREASGEYVWIAESDDIADPALLQTIMGMIDDNGLDLCFAQSTVVNEEGESIDMFPSERCLENHPLFTFDDISETMCTHCIVPNASAVVFRRCLALPYLDQILAYRMSGDWLLWTYIIHDGDRCGYVSEPLNYCRRHDVSASAMSSRHNRHIAEAFDVLRRFKSRGMPYNAQYWIDLWLKRNGYNAKALLHNNFWPVFKSLIRLRPDSWIVLVKSLVSHK